MIQQSCNSQPTPTLPIQPISITNLRRGKVRRTQQSGWISANQWVGKERQFQTGGWRERFYWLIDWFFFLFFFASYLGFGKWKALVDVEFESTGEENGKQDVPTATFCWVPRNRSPYCLYRGLTKEWNSTETFFACLDCASLTVILLWD